LYFYLFYRAQRSEKYFLIPGLKNHSGITYKRCFSCGQERNLNFSSLARYDREGDLGVLVAFRENVLGRIAERAY